ncbi:MAG: chemotaxis protein CheD, partial [Brevundimonas sp.]
MRAGDQLTAERRVHVGQGEHLVTSDPDVVLSTVLGSCVAMCLRDPVAGVGGMNHFMLPEGAGAGTDAGRRYGAYAMELLI